MANSVEVVLTPMLLPLYEVAGKVVVVIDILRATSSMCVAFQTGVEKILPVATPDECRLFHDFDFLCAAERNAQKVEGFDMGNSPFEFQNPLIRDRKVAFTTTNGTRAIKMSKELGAKEIAIGSFLNLDALSDWLIAQNSSVILLCAGWKDKFNLEDFMYAGAVVDRIRTHFNIDCDSSLAAESIWHHQNHNLENFIRQSSHAKRFTTTHSQGDDVKFCLQLNTMKIVPVMAGEYLVAGKEIGSEYQLNG